MDRNLHELTTFELNKLFLEESNKFLALLNQDPDSADLQLIKRKVKLVMDLLDCRKDRVPIPGNQNPYTDPSKS